MPKTRVIYRAFANGQEKDFEYQTEASGWARRGLIGCPAYYRGSVDRVIVQPDKSELVERRVRSYYLGDDGIVRRDRTLER